MLLSVLRNRLALQHLTHPAARHRQVATSRPVPAPRAAIQTATDFLSALGRSCETKLRVADWSELWQMGGAGMKKAGVGVKDRRYILWSLEKFRQGHDPAAFAYPESLAKKIRSWGPSVQFGKRIRSRRHR